MKIGLTSAWGRAVPELLIPDEMGYSPLDRLVAHYLLHLISRRHQKEKHHRDQQQTFGEWGDIFTDQMPAAALLDRLLQRSTTISIRGQVYRSRETLRPASSSNSTMPSRRFGLN